MVQPQSIPGADGSAHVLVVGPDGSGRWLVQESFGTLEGYFISFEAALGFARRERHGIPGATVAVSCAPLTRRIARRAPA